MKRRSFAKKLLAGAALTGLQGWLPAIDRNAKPTLIKPPALKPGDSVGLIAPASPFPPERYNKAVQHIQSLGLEVRPSRYLREEHGYLAGTDSERLADLHQMYRDQDIAALWCIRGGYGSGRLLPNIDYRLIRRHPKLLIGYSDITALHLAIALHSSVAGIHGPVASSDFTDFTVSHLTPVIFGKETDPIIGPPPYDGEGDVPDHFEPYVIKGGKVDGELIGGNLTLMSSLAGTPYLPSFRDKLVFIEDVGEKPYRIDRMLTQLIQASDIGYASGILLGIFEDCQPDPGDSSLSLRQALQDRIGSLDIPAAYGFPFGHISNQCSLPVGIWAEADMDNLRIRLLEKAVS